MFGIILDKLDTLDTKVDSLDTKVDSLDTRVDSLDTKVDSLDTRVIKNSVNIESIRNDLKTIIEVQKAHMDQNERDHEKIMKHIDDKTDLLKDILKRHSEEITTLKRKIG
jgi:hypothetical protein